MQIKDVEKLTGLTAKSIRYYESKGLITIERNEENSYRSYSEADVNQLKKIKLFRYLDFSVEEISQLLDKEDAQVKEALMNKAEIFQEQRNSCESKQELCLTLAKDYSTDPRAIDEYNDAIEFLESDEMNEMWEDLKDYACPNIWVTILWTLVFSGPILWLFYNINNERQDALLLNAVFALAGTAFLTANWIHYVRQYRRNKRRVKKNNREFGWTLPIMIVACIAGISAFVGLMVLAEKLMAPTDYLFYEQHSVAGTIMIWLTMIPVVLICVLLVAKLRKKTPEQMEKMNDVVYIWNHLGKVRPVAIVLWLIGVYCCITSVTFVTGDSIVYHSPLHPVGIVYEYSDVEKITTGFGNKNFSFSEYKRKGNFYYQINVDGRDITFHVPSVNESVERFEDSYLELEEFDQDLVKLGITKEGNSEGYENCDLDSRYVERFLRIVELK